MDKAKLQAKVRDAKTPSGKHVGITPTKRDPSKYKAMFDRLQQLEKKDSHIKEVKPPVEKPQPAPVIKAVKEVPKKQETKPTPAARVVTKKEKNIKLKERIKVKAVKPTTSKTESAKKVKPKVTGKKLVVAKAQKSTPKKVVKQKSSVRSESVEEKSVSAKSNEVTKTIQKSVQASKKRTLDPRDEIPKFEKFHRKPRVHNEEDEPVKAPEPKVRVQKPRQQKPVATVVDAMLEEMIEVKKSPQKHVTTPVVLETPQQTTTKKHAAEKKQPKPAPKIDDIGDDLLLSEMLASNSKNVQPADNVGLNMLTAEPESPPVEAEEHEPEAQNLDELQDLLMATSSPKKIHSSTKKSTNQRSSAKNEDSAKPSDTKRKSTKGDKSETKKKTPEPIIEEVIDEEISSEKKESPVKEPFSFIDSDPMMDELNDMMLAKPAQQESAKKSFQKSSKKKESRASSGVKVEPAGLGILTGGFGGDEKEPEVIEEEQPAEEEGHEASVEVERVEEESNKVEDVHVEEEDVDEDDANDEQEEEVVSSAKNSPVRNERFSEPIHESSSLFGNPHGMFSHPTGSLFGLQEESAGHLQASVPQEVYTGGSPAKPDVIDNELDQGSGENHNSESSMESRHKGSSHSSSYNDKNDHDQAMVRSEDKEAHQGSNSREGGKLILEPLNQEQDTGSMLLSNQVRSFENENGPITLETSNLNRSRTETPDKAFHDTSLDPQKHNSSSKVNDGTDFSFY